MTDCAPDSAIAKIGSFKCQKGSGLQAIGVRPEDVMPCE